MEPILYVRGPNGEFVRTGGAISSINGKTGAVAAAAGFAVCAVLAAKSK